LSPWGYLLFTGWAILVATLIEREWLAGLLLIELIFGLTHERGGLRILVRLRFWVLILSALVLGSLLSGEPDVVWGPLHLSRQGSATGLEMGGRATALMLAFSLGVAALSLSDVVAVFDRLGLRGLGFATALALNMLATLQEMALVTLQTIRLRGGIRRPWTALRLFLITTVANTLHYGDEVIDAAAMRAFDPQKHQPMPLPLRRADLWLLISLIGCTGFMLVAGM
jgi:energy-coupling factor transporter transmembrane protein EcfT